MSKKHVVVLRGGVSSEHDVSIRSGAQVAKYLDRNYFDVTCVTITRDGLWAFPDEDPIPLAEALVQLHALRPDCVFLTLHGPYGEDGRFQGMFDLLGIPYVGSGCAASALALDKIRCKALVGHDGIRVARQRVFDQPMWLQAPETVLSIVERELGFPCVIKSPLQGSSLGMAIPQNSDEFIEGMNQVLNVGDVAMVEEYLKGVEVTCAVFDIDPYSAPIALPVTEIRPVTAAYFDYTAKYTPGATQEITPAEISEEIARKVQETAVRVHEIVGCRHLSRSDMILVDGEPVWIEVNTIPGMTETSLYPQAAAAVGISFPALMEKFVAAAIASRKDDDEY